MSVYTIALVGVAAFALVIGVGIVLGKRAAILPKRFGTHRPVDDDDSVPLRGEWSTSYGCSNKCGE